MSGKIRLFVLLEGRVLDPPFYDEVMASYPGVKDGEFDLRLIEQIDRNGVGSGGKSAALAIHDFFRSRGLLKQETKQGPRNIVFMLDRDYDNIAGTMRRSRHIVYTRHADVEAEIFAHGDLTAALQGSLSLTRNEATLLAARIGDPLTRVANHWSDWILLCALAIGLKARCSVQPSRNSAVHPDLIGNVDSAEVGRLLAEVRTRSQSASPVNRERQVRARIAATYARSEGALLVKGKWVAPFLFELVKAEAGAGVPVDYSGFRDAITRTLVTHIGPGVNWAGHWHDALDALDGT